MHKYKITFFYKGADIAIIYLHADSIEQVNEKIQKHEVEVENYDRWEIALEAYD